MFGATQGSLGSVFYRTSRDGVTSAILIVIALSLIYWLTVVVAEIYGLVTEQSTRERITGRFAGKAGAGGSSSRGKKLASSSSDGSSSPKARKDDAAEADIGPVETESNPLFLVGQSRSDENSLGGLDLDAVRAMQSVPTQTAWEFIQAGFLETSSQIEALEAEKARLADQLRAATSGGRAATVGVKVGKTAAAAVASSSSSRGSRLVDEDGDDDEVSTPTPLARAGSRTSMSASKSKGGDTSSSAVSKREGAGPASPTAARGGKGGGRGEWSLPEAHLSRGRELGPREPPFYSTIPSPL
jgi:hypothetical protein